MRKPESDFRLWDIILLGLATLFTFLILRVRLLDSVNTDRFGKSLITLSLSVSFAIFIGQYKALRKRKVFVAWTALALIMLGMFFWLHNDPTLTYSENEGSLLHNYAISLKVPFIILAIYASCRYFSKRFFKTELLLPSRNLDMFDYEENRHFNLMDYIWTALSLIAIFVGSGY